MYETRRLHFCSDALPKEETSYPELVVEVTDTHVLVSIEHCGRDMATIRIPFNEGDEFASRLSAFVHGEIERIAKENVE